MAYDRRDLEDLIRTARQRLRETERENKELQSTVDALTAKVDAARHEYHSWAHLESLRHAPSDVLLNIAPGVAGGSAVGAARAGPNSLASNSRSRVGVGAGGGGVGGSDAFGDGMSSVEAASTPLQPSQRKPVSAEERKFIEWNAKFELQIVNEGLRGLVAAMEAEEERLARQQQQSQQQQQQSTEPAEEPVELETPLMAACRTHPSTSSLYFKSNAALTQTKTDLEQALLRGRDLAATKRLRQRESTYQELSDQVNRLRAELMTLIEDRFDKEIAKAHYLQSALVEEAKMKELARQVDLLKDKLESMNGDWIRAVYLSLRGVRTIDDRIPLTQLKDTLDLWFPRELVQERAIESLIARLVSRSTTTTATNASGMVDWPAFRAVFVELTATEAEQEQ